MNRESERKRLVELIAKSGLVLVYGGIHPDTHKCQESLADYLLDNGIVVPPVKVGQKLYLISDGLYWEAEVIRVVIRQGEDVDPCIVFVRLKDGNIKAILDIYNDIGKTVFTSREDAEAKLKGGER